MMTSLRQFRLAAGRTPILQVILVLALVSGCVARAAAQETGPTLAELKAQHWTAGDLALLPRAPESLMQSAAASWALPTAPIDIGDWTRIAFQSHRDNNWEIYTARGDGMEPVRLTREPAADTRPRFNGDLSKLVFASSRSGNSEIYTMNSDGTGARQLTFHGPSDNYPVWSPDGTRIAFAYNGDEDWEIYVMDADGENQTRLTFGGGADISPTWSPDGQQIAWTRISGTGGSVMVMNTNGANQHSVTPYLRYLQNPIWSPDGSQLAFDYDFDGDNWNELAMTSAENNGAPPRLIFDAVENFVDVWMGSWSPNSGQIMFTLVSYVVQGGQLYVGASGFGRIPLQTPWQPVGVPGSGLDMHPNWRGTDFIAPQSQVSALPPYSRASGFTVNWIGTDAGGAGIASYDVQYRIGADGAWIDWINAAASTSALFSRSPGDVAYLRCRARDAAGNLEPWRAAADANTTLFASEVTGAVSDVRDRPIPGAAITADPAGLAPIVADAGGRYRGFLLVGQGQEVFTAAHPGYGSPPHTLAAIAGDTAIDHILPPLESWLRGGLFETGAFTPAWRPYGVPTPAVTNAKAHTGGYTAMIGKPFALTASEEASHGWNPTIAIDAQGTIYLVGTRTISVDNEQGAGVYEVQYATKLVDGTWPITPTALITLTGLVEGMIIIADQQGGIHMAWGQRPRFGGSSTIRYCHKPVDAEVCASPINITDPAVASGGSPHMALDHLGGIHMIWHGTGGMHYAYRPVGGTWQSAEIVTALTGSGGKVAIDATGRMHVVWSYFPDMGDRVFTLYSSKVPGGAWEPAVEIAPGGQWTFPNIAVTEDGTAHVSWLYLPMRADDPNEGVYYTMKSPGGVWVPSVRLGSSPRGPLLTLIGVDGVGILHLAFQDGAGPLVYAAKRPTGVWQRLSEQNLPDLWALAGAVDRLGALHIAWQPPPFGANPVIYHMQTDMASTETHAGLAQLVSIPTEAHRPTLSFFSRSHPILPDDALQISVNGETLPADAVVTTNVSQDWTHAWADLGRWTGQTVTVTFDLRQRAMQPYAELYLDDITLGAWRTPVIGGVTPCCIPPNTVRTITITGENFASTPAVRVDDTLLTDVQWLDENTLRANLPGNLGLGRHELWVTNPEEQVGVGGLRVGWFIFLPLSVH